MKNNYIYLVEGKCEERLLKALKENPQKIQGVLRFLKHHVAKEMEKHELLHLLLYRIIKP